MKKLVLFALILTLGAQVAGAVTPPLANTWYRCDYQTGGHFNEKDPGFSIFKISGAPTLLRGIEDYEA
nr:hypothetical protein [Thermoanaerobaculia bacterium]